MKSPIVIIGGGFGGVYTTKRLLKAGFPVTLISESNFFTFTPLLHELATGGLTSDDVTFEYSSFFHHKQFQFIRGHVDKIDMKAHKILVDDTSISFQDLVIATGSTTQFYDIKGTEYCYTLKTVEDALHLKRHLIETAQGTNQNVQVNVIGAGPTGVELILEIDSFMKDIQKHNGKVEYHLRLINAGETVLAPFSAPIQQYAQYILEKRGVEVVHRAIATELTPTQVKTSAGAFNSNATIMTAGVMPRTKCLPSQTVDKHKYITVNDHLQVKGYKSIFALGDIIAINNRPVPKLAQTAVSQADIVAKNIIRRHQQRPLLAYTIKLKGSLVSLGTHRGAGTIFGITIKGFFAWWLWRTVYLFKTPGFSNKLRVAFSWTIGLFTGKDLSER